MRIKLSTKIFTVMSLLAAIAVVITLIGTWEMSVINEKVRLIVEVTNKENDGLARVRVLISDVVRAQKNAVICSEDEQCKAFALKSRGAVEATRKAVDEMELLLGKNPRTSQDELKTWNEIKAGWESYAKMNDDILNLAVQNSNVKAADISAKKALGLMRKLESSLTELSSKADKKLEEALAAKNESKASHYSALRRTARDVMILTSQVQILHAAHINSTGEEEMKELDGRIGNLLSKGSAAVVQLAGLIDSEDAEVLKGIESNYKEYARDTGEIQKLSHMNTNLASAELSVNKARAVYDQLDKALTTETEYLARDNAQSAKEAEQAYRTGKWVLGMVSVVGIVAVGLVAGVIVRGLVRSLNQISKVLGEGAHQVASASGQVSGSSQSLAQGASEQAAALEETTSALEEMSSMTKKSAETAQQAAALANEANKTSTAGNQAMEKMTDAINQIHKAAGDTAKIIKVIDEIAFQTNLLALNAAVEAARAGEAGKGFAVVAEEVRNLAMRSAEAAKNTSSLIESAVESAKNGVAISSEVAKMLGLIQGNATKVNDLVGEISAAAKEQSQGIDQVNKAVGDMDKVTQSSAANAEETAAAAEELSSQAEQVLSVVRNLNEIITGQRKEENRESVGGKKHVTQKVNKVAGDTAKVAKSHKVEIPLDAEEELQGAGKSSGFGDFN